MKTIERKLESDRLLAKTLIQKGHMDRAKLLLKKKRYQEQLLSKTDGQLENLERLTHDIEFAQIEMRVIDGLRQGNEALRKVNEALSIEDVEKILEETREGIEKQQEIDELLNGVLTEEDETAVMDELATLVGEYQAEALPDVPENDLVSQFDLSIKQDIEEGKHDIFS